MHRIAVEILPRTGTNQAEQNFDFKPDGALERLYVTPICEMGRTLDTLYREKYNSP